MIDINEIKRQITDALCAQRPLIASYNKLPTDANGRVMVGNARFDSGIAQKSTSFFGTPFVDTDPDYAYFVVVMNPIHNVEYRVYGSGYHVDLVRSFGIEHVVTRETLLAAVAEEQTVLAMLRRIAKLNIS